MLKLQPEQSREDRMRALFESSGGMSTAAFTQRCRDEGIWDDDEWESLAFRQAQNEVRRALKKLDNVGLPFAGQTTITDDDGAVVWMTRRMWSFEDYAVNINELVEQRDRCHDAAVALADECRNRHGRAPSLARRDIDEAA